MGWKLYSGILVSAGNSYPDEEEPESEEQHDQPNWHRCQSSNKGDESKEDHKEPQANDRSSTLNSEYRAPLISIVILVHDTFHTE